MRSLAPYLARLKNATKAFFNGLLERLPRALRHLRQTICRHASPAEPRKPTSAYEDGMQAGQHWAHHAEGIEAELRHLQALATGKSEVQWRDWFLSQEADRPAFQRLVRGSSRRPPARREVSAFWQTAVELRASLAPRALRDSAFVQGFADGLRVWEESGAAGERLGTARRGLDRRARRPDDRERYVSLSRQAAMPAGAGPRSLGFRRLLFVRLQPLLDVPGQIFVVAVASQADGRLGGADGVLAAPDLRVRVDQVHERARVGIEPCARFQIRNRLFVLTGRGQ